MSPEEVSDMAAVREFLRGVTPSNDGDFVIADEAEKILGMLEEYHQDLLARWQRQLTVTAIAATLREVQRSERSRARRATSLSQNAEKLSAAVEAGSVDVFAQPFHIGGGVHRPLGDMTGQDHTFVAERYEMTSKREAFEAVFHRVLAKKVGKHRTADVLTPEQYLSIRGSLPTAA